MRVGARGRGRAWIAAALTLAACGAFAVPAAAVEQRPSVTLTLKPRAAYAYRHEYTLAVRVRGAVLSRPLSLLRVAASGSMNEPGHAMKAGPTPLRSAGAGTYRGAVAFYMAGKWRIRITVSGRGVLVTTKSFDVTLK